MRRIAAKLLIGVTITALGVFGADSSLGTWKFNAAKSKSTGTNPTQSRTEVFEATADGGVKVTRMGQRADGTTETDSATTKYDGKEYPTTGQAGTISLKRIDANTTIREVRLKRGPLHETIQSVISQDGKTRTDTVTGFKAPGIPVTATLVFDRQ
jgi:hypothetical protein